jgi:hypothetical protein
LIFAIRLSRSCSRHLLCWWSIAIQFEHPTCPNLVRYPCRLFRKRHGDRPRLRVFRTIIQPPDLPGFLLAIVSPPIVRLPDLDGFWSPRTPDLG